MNPPYLVLDIETAPLAESELIFPEFSAPSNYKDAEKIAANIAEQRIKFVERAALSATSGKILAIGVMDPITNDARFYHGEDEHKLLQEFLLTEDARHFIGHNLVGFDLPFMKRRYWKHGLWLNVKLDRREHFDTMIEYSCGNREDRISLDGLAKFLGQGEKNGSGKDFAAIYRRNPEAALAYLHNDLKLTLACARVMGITSEAIMKQVANLNLDSFK